MKRPRHLSTEEKALWGHVARQTDPLTSRRADPAPDPAPPAPRATLPAPRPAPPKPFRVGEAVDHKGTHDLLPSLAGQLSQEALRMDQKLHSKLKRGKLTPEARIDLHGMTLAEAHPELIHFILMAQAGGKRLVLVITGKGKDRDFGGPIPTRFGVLRHQVPQWLKMAPLGRIVLQVLPASRRHGGDGAYYVYLKRG